jgi:hypothetical protein
MGDAATAATTDELPTAAPPAEPRRWSVGADRTDLARRVRGLAPSVAALLTTLWMFRDTFLHDRLPGDIGDGRWTVSITEHWYRVWTGDEALRDLAFFYPKHDTLGASDPFFVQGQLYALARALGMGQLDAWFLCHLLTFAIGALGVAVLARRVLVTTTAQIAFAVLSCASYPLIIQMGHIQVIGFLWVAWLFVGIDAIHTATSARGVRCGLALVLIVPPLLATSSWYAFALGVTLIATIGLFEALVHEGSTIVRTIRLDARRVWDAVRSPVGAVVVVAAAVLWAFAAWVYLPALSLLPDPTWSEVPLFSPRWSDIVNAAWQGGGIWGPLYDDVFDGGGFNGEQALGFTPVLLVAFLVVGLGMLRRLALRRDEPGEVEPGAVAERSAVRGRLLGPRVPVGTRGLLACWLAVLATIFVFLVDERGLGLFHLVWGRVPGSEAVRAPYRGQILAYPLVTFVVLRAIERAVLRLGQPTVVDPVEPSNASSPGGRRGRRGRQVVAAGLGVLLATFVAVEMHRPSAWFWSPDDLLLPGLRAQVATVHDQCDVMILTEHPAERPVWAFEIDAVILSMLSDVPTPQGYSRASPIGHPGFGADSDSLVTWMRAEGYDGPICLVDYDGVRIV